MPHTFSLCLNSRGYAQTCSAQSATGQFVSIHCTAISMTRLVFVARDYCAPSATCTPVAPGTHHRLLLPLLQKDSMVTTSADSQGLIYNTERHVMSELSSRDASHDFSHIDRVRKLALQLGKAEGLDTDSLHVVEVAALLHDIRDWKYSSASDQDASDAIRSFLSEQQQSEQFMQRIIDIVDCIGFKDELGGQPCKLSKEAAVVQDADRLDAIGAIGIARCFTFGGSKHRVLHDPSVAPRDALTKEAYMTGANTTTINHFYEKLLKVKGLMKTKAGAQVAEQRHAFMEAYLQQFLLEWDGLA